jgi:hypothetical protein
MPNSKSQVHFLSYAVLHKILVHGTPTYGELTAAVSRLDGVLHLEQPVLLVYICSSFDPQWHTYLGGRAWIKGSQQPREPLNF